MTRRYFGTDGIRGLANKHPMTSDGGVDGRDGGRKAVPDGEPPAPGRDR